MADFNLFLFLFSYFMFIMADDNIQNNKILTIDLVERNEIEFELVTQKKNFYKMFPVSNLKCDVILHKLVS